MILNEFKMTVRPNIYIVLGALFFLLTWLFVGIFRDDEFYEPYLFTKFQPTFKVLFYSPIGMQDLGLEDLTADKQLEEIAFQKFVIERQQQNNANAPFWYLPFILIQLTLTFLTFSPDGLRKRLDNKLWILLIHFAINLITTSLMCGFILLSDNIGFAVGVMAAIVVMNYATARLLSSRKRTSHEIYIQ